MKRLLYVMAISMLIFLLLSAWTAFAQTPKVPITYEGDTAETIARRAQWVEGAKKEGMVLWWGTIGPDLGIQLGSRFSKIYPFIKVHYWRGRGEEIASRLETEFNAGRHSVDICLGGEPINYPRWRKMGMIAKFTDNLPGMERIPPSMFSSFGDWIVPGSQAITPQYNTNLVSAAEAPKEWDDLLDPKWKGHMGLTRDMKVWYTLALGDGGWGIEKTEDYLRKLATQNLIWAAGHTAGLMLLVAGEFKILVEGYDYQAALYKEQGAPVEWVKTSQVAITGSSFTLQKYAPHGNAARLFLEWQFSPQGLAAFEEVTGKGAAFPGSGTRISKALEGLTLCFRTEDVLLKAEELGLTESFSRALGITK